MSYALREAAASVRRTPLLALLAVVAITLSLFVIGLFALAAFNIRLAIDQIEERVEVVAYLRDDASAGQVEVARGELLALPEVLETRYVSKTEALATAVEELEEFREVFANLEVNPLPASLEIRLQPGFRHPEAVEAVAEHLLVYPFVEDVEFGREWVARIVSLRRIAGGATMLIGGAFGAVAAIIIATAVRISVFARREEIAIMRLVGATDRFIGRPFLIEGLTAGLLGGGLAVALTYAAYQLVDHSFLRLAWPPASWAWAAVAAGTAYGLLSSAFAVRRHLRSA